MFTSLFIQPFYNVLIFLMDILPFFDAGVIIVIFTCIIKILLFPLSISAAKSQIVLKNAEKDIESIKNKYTDKQEQSQKILEYYKEKQINPFAGIFILLIQLPIIIGIYQVFLKSGLPEVNTELLYSFVSSPQSINMLFLNFIDISQKSLILALLAGITTFFQIHFSGNNQKRVEQKGDTMQAEVIKMMTTQMKYVFPVVIIFISYGLSGAISLYWVATNIFSIGQEIYIRKKYHEKALVIA